MRAQRDPRRPHVVRSARRHAVRAPSCCSPGCVIGWRPGNGLVGVVAGLAVAVLFAYALSWFTACIGLLVSDPESAQGIG